MKHIFHVYHPVVTGTYILAALFFSMSTMHPGCIVVSFLTGSIYSVYLNGFHRFRKTLTYILILFLLIIIVNPLFNPNGITVLFYLFDNPVTLESLVYGIASGGMLASVLVWFTCCRALVTNEKFLYLFGKLLPTVTLMLSMIFRLIPVTGYKIQCIRNAQKTMVPTAITRNQKAMLRIRSVSILLSWSMEDCIETADAMKARGYGSGKRTSFTVYRWCLHDILSLVLILLLACLTGYWIFGFMVSYQYFPAISQPVFNTAGMAGYMLYTILLLYPLLLEFRETVKWK